MTAKYTETVWTQPATRSTPVFQMSYKSRLATFAELDQGSDWFKSTGDKIVDLRKILVFDGLENSDGFEITFINGSRAFVGFPHQRLHAVVADGVGYLRTTSVTRTQGKVTGPCTSWLRMFQGPRVPLNPNTAKRCSEEKLYQLLTKDSGNVDG